jgi:PBP1b-binding outer membrane lipoprotein LpoB
LCLILLLGGCVEVQGVEEQTETAVPPTAVIAVRR